MKPMSGHWSVSQLERLARKEPEKVRAILDALRSSLPELYTEMVMTSVDKGEMTEDDAARELGTDSVTVAMRLAAFRGRADADETEPISFDGNGVARIEGKHVTVWEIVREFRRAGSVSAMRDQFPGLNETELRAALVYAGRNPDEIGGQIRAYEDLVERRSAAYPFAKPSS